MNPSPHLQIKLKQVIPKTEKDNIPTVFPDCELRVVFSAIEALEEVTVGTYSLSREGGNNGKDSNCR